MQETVFPSAQIESIDRHIQTEHAALTMHQKDSQIEILIKQIYSKQLTIDQPVSRRFTSYNEILYLFR